jgi:DNA-binding CsgD family transcriptional regulator
MVSSVLMERAHVLWDDIASRSGSIEETADHLMATLCDWLGCDGAVWIGTTRLAIAPDREPLGAWRPVAVRELDQRGASVMSCSEVFKAIATEDVGLTDVLHAQMAGAFRATRLCDLVPESWFESEHYRRYLERDLSDVVTVVFPVSERCESYFVFVRRAHRPRFSESERDALAYALRGLGWFHRHLALFYGALGSSAPLTATERRVLRHLLAGAADKDIAAALQIGLHGARKHVAALYEKFRVSSRAELMALWLGQGR